MKKRILEFGALGIIVVIIVILLVAFKTYTVTFDSKMGTSVAAQEVRKNKQVTKPNDPIMEGYKFVGWYLDDELFDFETPITKDITLIGHWEKIE